MVHYLYVEDAWSIPGPVDQVDTFDSIDFRGENETTN